MLNGASPYFGKCVAMTTKHAKSIVVAPRLKEILGAAVAEYPLDTDGAIPRACYEPRVAIFGRFRGFGPRSRHTGPVHAPVAGVGTPKTSRF